MFDPCNLLLGSFLEGTIFNFEITYVKDGVFYPVTVEAVTPFSTVDVKDNTIKGYFTNSFENKIEYLDEDGNSVKLNNLRKVPIERRSSVISFEADPTEYISFYYTASANGETATYTINALNDYFVNRNILMQYVNPEAYAKIIATWRKGNKSIKWYNDKREKPDWIKGPWPWSLEEA